MCFEFYVLNVIYYYLMIESLEQHTIRRMKCFRCAKTLLYQIVLNNNS